MMTKAALLPQQEALRKKAYAPEQLEQMLQLSGMELLAVYGDDTMEPPGPKAKGLIYVAVNRLQ